MYIYSYGFIDDLYIICFQIYTKKGSAYQQLPGQLKVLQIIPIDRDSKILSAERESIVFGLNKNDQIFFRISSGNNWIMLPGLLNRATAMHRVGFKGDMITVIGLNKSNDLYRAGFDLKGNMLENWENKTNGENYSDIVDIYSGRDIGIIMLDKAGNMFN